jgi:hypothetical protein
MEMMNTSMDEVRALCALATMDDLERIVGALDRWPRPTGVAVSLDLARTHPDRRGDVEEGIALEIARASSAPMTRAARRAFFRPKRDEIHDAVTEVAKRLDVRVRVPTGGTLKGRLAGMTGALVDRAVLAMPAHEQQRLGIEVLDRIDPRSNAREIARAAAVPALYQALGPVALKAVEAVVIEAVGVFVGRHVARLAIGAALTKLPAAASILGPAAIAGGVALTAYELQKPAFRKLVPAFVALGFVALRATPPRIP